jgi:hypothetical protein
MRGPNHHPTPAEACSYRQQKSLKVFARHGKIIILQRTNIAFNGLADVCDRLLTVFTLRETPGKTRTLGNPKSVLCQDKSALVS